MPEQPREMGFVTSAGEGRGQLSLIELCRVRVWLFLVWVVAGGWNLYTIPLPGLICRNDLSGEEFQQLLHSTFHPAWDRQGAAQPGIQVPIP